MYDNLTGIGENKKLSPNANCVQAQPGGGDRGT